MWACGSVGGGDVGSIGAGEPVREIRPTEQTAPPVALPTAPEGCPKQLAEVVGSEFKGDPRLLDEHLIVVAKSARRIMRYSQGSLLRDKDGRPLCFKMGLGFAPTGHKQQEGDGRTPEGWYRTSDKPTSQFYGAIAVHYPNEQDAALGVQSGRITAGQQAVIARALQGNTKPPQRTKLGGEILIHGGGGETDWTLGCVAVDNGELDRLRASLPVGMLAQVLIVK